MAKPGRKRKPGAREPNGRPSRAEQERVYSPAAIKRMTDAAVMSAHDARLGTVLGRMLLAGDITPRQAGAGWQWAEIAFEYYQAIGATPLHVKAAGFERGAKGEAPDLDTPAGEAMSERDKRTVRRFDRAFVVLQSQGAESATTCRRLCEGRGIAPDTYEQRVAAIRALDALAAHFAAC
jgi:hypothetical protein